MAYRIYQFGSVALPIYNASQEQTVSVASTQTLAIGGVADYYGARRRVPQITQFSVKGIYSGELYYLTNEAGANLVDAAGNRLIAHATDADLRLQLDELRAVIGTRDTLWRKRWDDLAVQWKLARLLQVRRSTATKDRTVMADLEAVFEAPDAQWRASAQTTASATLVNCCTVTLVAENAGDQTVEDAVLTITADGGTITSITVACADTGVSWVWTGTLATGTSLVVDAGALTVRQAGSDSYVGFALASGHTARTWLPLAPGINSLQIVSVGPGSASIAFYSQFA